MEDTMEELDTFVEAWVETEEKNRAAFLRLKEHLKAMPGVTLNFLPRPGVTYSLRAVHEHQKDKSLFAMVDVIEEEPRWLSVCFYNAMVHDPEEKGDFVPDGLLGEDAVCFDLEAYDENALKYIEARLNEACQSAA